MLRAARVPPERQALLRQADVRYRRQAYELTVPIADGAITRATLDDLAEAFHARHEQTYGHANRAEACATGQSASDGARPVAGSRAGAARRSGERTDAASRRVVRRDRIYADAGALARRADAWHARSPVRRSSRRWIRRRSCRRAGRRVIDRASDYMWLIAPCRCRPKRCSTAAIPADSRQSRSHLRPYRSHRCNA